MNNTITFRLWAAVLAAGILNAASSADVLKPGSPAPALKVNGWVKGKEVKELEKGKIYVVEFWATWCGPCKATIPHLTELAKKYKDITFIGVDSFERPADNLDEVKKFVAEMGEKMDYNVAVDGSAAFMAKNWMEAAEQKGIPTAFVVDKDGLIAWIGHPMEMEPVLEKVVSGKLNKDDVAKEQQAKVDEQKKAEAMQEKLMPHLQKFQGRVEAGDFKGAVEELDATFKDVPESEAQLGPVKFEFMARLADPKANDYAKHLYEKVLKEDGKTDDQTAINLNQVAWYLVDDDVNYKAADYGLAVKIAEKAVKLSKGKEASIMDTLAYAYFKNKQLDKAIATQEKAVALSKTDPAVDEETKQELADRLSKFKKAKSGGG